jgi:hypothetical protein
MRCYDRLSSTMTLDQHLWTRCCSSWKALQSLTPAIDVQAWLIDWSKWFAISSFLPFIVTNGYPWPSNTVKSLGFFKPRETHGGAQGTMGGPNRLGHLARPPAATALAAICECLWRTHKQTNGDSRRSPCNALLLFLYSLLFSRPKSRSWYFWDLKSPTS